MKKSILELGEVLTKVQQKSITGGDPPCFEWCADEDLQEHFPLAECSCGSNGGGPGGGSGSGDDGGPGNAL